MNATLSDLGITGVQSRVMHYILSMARTARCSGTWKRPLCITARCWW